MNAFQELEQIAEALKNNRTREPYNGTWTGLSRRDDELLRWYFDPSYPTPRGYDGFAAMVITNLCADIPHAATDKDGSVRDGKCQARARQLWEEKRTYVATLWRAAEKQIGKPEQHAIDDLASAHHLRPSFARCFYRFVRACMVVERGDNPAEVLAKAEALHRRGTFTFLNNLRAWIANRDLIAEQKAEQKARQIPADYTPDFDFDFSHDQDDDQEVFR